MNAREWRLSYFCVIFSLTLTNIIQQNTEIYERVLLEKLKRIQNNFDTCNTYDNLRKPRTSCKSLIKKRVTFVKSPFIFDDLVFKYENNHEDFKMLSSKDRSSHNCDSSEHLFSKQAARWYILDEILRNDEQCMKNRNRSCSLTNDYINPDEYGKKNCCSNTCVKYLEL